VILEIYGNRTILNTARSVKADLADHPARMRGDFKYRRLDFMPTGTVKWFNTTKGYGFIAPEDGGNDVFVHISAVEQSGLTGLADEQKVSFEFAEGRDGRKMASDISLL
jgi:CspA family cold shock protein